MKLKKLDKRHKGHSMFKYMAEFRYSESEKFYQARNWCWEQWGPSSELNLMHRIESSSQQWGWAVEEFSLRLYVATDKEYQWFILRWHA